MTVRMLRPVTSAIAGLLRGKRRLVQTVPARFGNAGTCQAESALLSVSVGSIGEIESILPIRPLGASATRQVDKEPGSDLRGNPPNHQLDASTPDSPDDFTRRSSKRSSVAIPKPLLRKRPSKTGSYVGHCSRAAVALVGAPR
jgi:hypothetical protein